MFKLPAHIQRYLEHSPYGPFSEDEVKWLAGRVKQDPAPYRSEDTVEFDLLSHRAAHDPTPRNVAILNNAVGIRAKAKGMRGIAVICACGSRNAHYDVDGTDPMQRFCDDCNAPLSNEQIQRAVDGKLKALGDEFRRKHVSN